MTVAVERVLALEGVRRRAIRRVKVALLNVAILLVLLVFLAPVYWIFVGAVKGRLDFYTYPPVFVPRSFEWANFSRVMALGGGKAILDSIIVALLNTSLVMIIGAPLSYSIARYRFGGRNLAFFILSLLFAPPVVAAIPLFLIFRTLRLLDSYIVLVLSYMLFNLPFATWLLKGFFEDVPEEIEQAALVDGYTRFQVLRRVSLPLIVPGLAVTALFVFIFSWNEFLFSLVFTRSNVTTLPVTLAGLIGGHGILWGELAALSALATLPGVFLAIFLQRYLIRGLTFGAVKG
jgi:multiple sugar transport system permease protein